MAPPFRGPEWSQPHMVPLPKHGGRGASLTYIEGNNQIPFSIARVFLLNEVKKRTIRGEHAHRDLEQFIIAINGAFDVVVFNGQRQWTFSLNAADEGLYMPPLHWGTLNNFSGAAAALVLASMPYDRDDYLPTYDDLLAEVRRRGGAPPAPQG